MASISAEKYAENIRLHGKFENMAEMAAKYTSDFEAVRARLNGPVDDVTLYRFLKGWKFNIDVTVDSLNQTLAWREENKVDAIRERVATLDPEDFPHEDKMRRVFPKSEHHGEDKQGQPITIERIGQIDLALFLKLFTEEELLDNMLHHIERKAYLQSQLTAKSGQLMRFCRIMDMEGVGTGHMNPAGLNMLRSVLSQGVSNYPESLGNMYIVNAPWIFSTIWGLISPLLKESTQKKIQILGADYQEVLLEAIDAKVLPTFLGGECETAGSLAVIDPKQRLTELSVSRGSSHTETVTIEGPSSVTWSTLLEANDISLKVEFKSGGSTSVKSESKITADPEVQVDSVELSSSGTLKFTFDNTYSYFTSKQLWFTTAVSPLTPSSS